MPFVTIWVPRLEDLERWGANTASILKGNDTYEGSTLYDSLRILITMLVPICVAILLWRQILVCSPREDARASAKASGDEEGSPPPYSVSAIQSQPRAQKKLTVPIYPKNPSYRKSCNKNYRKIRNLKGNLKLVVALNQRLRTQLRTQSMELENGSAECEILKRELSDSFAGIETLAQQLKDSNNFLESSYERVANRDAHIKHLNSKIAHREVTINELNSKIALWETCIRNHQAKFIKVSNFANESFWTVMRTGRLADDLAPLHLPVRVAMAVTEIQRVRDRIREMRRQLITKN